MKIKRALALTLIFAFITVAFTACNTGNEGTDGLVIEDPESDAPEVYDPTAPNVVTPFNVDYWLKNAENGKALTAIVVNVFDGEGNIAGTVAKNSDIELEEVMANLYTVFFLNYDGELGDREPDLVFFDGEEDFMDFYFDDDGLVVKSISEVDKTQFVYSVAMFESYAELASLRDHINNIRYVEGGLVDATPVSAAYLLEAYPESFVSFVRLNKEPPVIDTKHNEKIQELLGKIIFVPTANALPNFAPVQLRALDKDGEPTFTFGFENELGYIQSGDINGVFSITDSQDSVIALLDYLAAI